MNSRYISRWAETEYDLLCQMMRIVMVSGVRQCGKTTMVRNKAADETPFISFDHIGIAESAKNAPASFLKQYQDTPRIAFDEIQKAPELIGEMKAVVDENPIPGRFVITGSANYRSLPNVNESLAGRLGEVRLRTLTEGEIQGNSPNFLNRLLSNDFGAPLAIDECNKLLVIDKAIQGGYPQVIGQPTIFRQRWFANYIKSMIERDLKDIANFRKLQTMRQLLHFLALNSSQIPNITDIANRLQEKQPLIREYLNALKTLYLVEELPAWSKRDNDRIGRSPKWLISDTGLMCALANRYERPHVFRGDEQVDAEFTGRLLETWVYTQIVPIIDLNPDWEIYHFRTRNGKEIDFLLENNITGDLIGIEVKSAERVQQQDFRAMDWFAEKLAGQHNFKAVVLYTGNHVQQFSENRIALPMAYLWL